MCIGFFFFRGPTDELGRFWADESWSYFNRLRQEEGAKETGIIEVSAELFCSTHLTHLSLSPSRVLDSPVPPGVLPRLGPRGHLLSAQLPRPSPLHAEGVGPVPAQGKVEGGQLRPHHRHRLREVPPLGHEEVYGQRGKHPEGEGRQPATTRGRGLGRGRQLPGVQCQETMRRSIHVGQQGTGGSCGTGLMYPSIIQWFPINLYAIALGDEGPCALDQGLRVC